MERTAGAKLVAGTRRRPERVFSQEAHGMLDQRGIVHGLGNAEGRHRVARDLRKVPPGLNRQPNGHFSPMAAVNMSVTERPENSPRSD